MTDLLPALVLAPLGVSILTLLTQMVSRRVTVTISVVGSVAIAILTGFVVIAIGQHGGIGFALAGWDAPLGIELHADGLSAAMLALNALVGVAVVCYASSAQWVRGSEFFWPLWFALWSSLNSVYLAADLFNAYVALELMGVTAVSLVALGGVSAWQPALRYLFVAVVGSLVYLVTVAMVYGETGTLDLRLAAPLLNTPIVVQLILILATLGLVLKSALFPLHAWLPAAHSSAPTAVSAVLSALVVKASLYLLARVWFTLLDADVVDLRFLTGFATLLGAAGTLAVVWGSLLALRERRLKRIVAYSTVAQIGYLFLLFPLVTAGADADTSSALAGGARTAWVGGILMILAHGIAKTAMFLAAGALVMHHESDHLDSLRGTLTTRPVSVAAFVIAGGSLAGLPPTFGFVAKWQLLKGSIETGQWWWLAVLLIGGMFTYAYVARVVRATFAGTEDVPQAYARPAGASVSEATAQRIPLVIVLVPITLGTITLLLGFASDPLIELIGTAYPIGIGEVSP